MKTFTTFGLRITVIFFCIGLGSYLIVAKDFSLDILTGYFLAVVLCLFCLEIVLLKNLAVYAWRKFKK